MVLAEPVAAQVAREPVQAQGPVVARALVVVARAEVQAGPAEAAASRTWSVADKAPPALPACATKPLHLRAAQHRGARQSADQTFKSDPFKLCA
ncbi:hypothetical protein BCCGELA001_22225 [Bradyrhizobium sp. CCGE-LA001]|nr:hypothetical protein BCCGELA001_22225 [Bradyrhizobium sp. CCGE-LA001]